jgi:hypothetical protein
MFGKIYILKSGFILQAKAALGNTLAINAGDLTENQPKI